MKTTAFLVFYAGVLITLDNGVLASKNDKREGNEKVKGADEEIQRPRPSFPLLTLPSISSFSLPGLNFPYLQAFSQPNRMSSSNRVRETKTEYLEVTRRQTVHPVCYTAYESRAPCLPYAQSDFHNDDFDAFEPEAILQAHDGFNLNEVKKVIQSTPEKKSAARVGKYLELKLRRDGALETTRIEGSEFFPNLNPQKYTPQYHTKTVLITKLEKYTDRRVTATLLAVNCLPVDRTIPMCQNYPNPIREAPDSRSDDYSDFQTADYSPTQTSHGNLELVVPKSSRKTQPSYGGAKTILAVDVDESAD